MVRQWNCLQRLIALILLVLSNHCWAIITLHDHSPPLSIGKQIEILEDPSGQLTFDEVKSAQGFEASQASRPSYGFSSSVYWVRFRLASLSNIPDWYLQIRYPLLDFVDFYSPSIDKPGAYERTKAGDMVLPASGKRTQTYLQFPLVNDTKVRSYYLRIETSSSVIIDLQLLNAEQLAAQTVREQYFQGAYLGLMSVMAVYNFFVFLVIRDRSYLYYTGFIATTALFQIALHGYASVHFWPQSIWWNNVSNLFAACLSVAFCGKFAQSFIQLKRYHRYLDSALSWLSLLAFVISGLSLVIDYQLVVTLISITGLAVVSTSIIAAVFALRKGSRPAGFYLIAWVVLLVFGIIHILCILGIFPSYPALTNSVQIGGAVEAVLLSMGLADRINTLQREALMASNSANKIKDDFMSTITHELLTPVNGIKLSLDLLKQKPHSAEENQLLKTATESSTHLQNLIESMFNFVELRRGNARIKQENVDLKWLLTSVYDYFESINNNASLQLHFNWDDSLPQTIVGDEKKLTSIIVELTKNAFAFTQEGYISISATQVSGATPLLQVTIADSGQGIGREKLKHIFGAFEQGDNSHLRVHGGLGIGLTMANDILKLMGSRLDIQSEVGAGTTVSFKLPIQIPDVSNQYSHANKAADPDITPNRNGGAKILVVEDNPVNATLICKVLENIKLTPIAAKNGKEALRVLEEQLDISAVLMDCQMPVMDGFQATLAIRKDRHYRNIPIIAITANISSDDHERCITSGMNAVLTKPVKRSQLEHTLYKWLQRP